MRANRLIALDLEAVAKARDAAGLDASVPNSAVIRYAVAVLAGLPVGPALDATPGRGAASFKARIAAEQAAAEQAAADGGRAA